jgi:hypothetical protein
MIEVRAQFKRDWSCHRAGSPGSISRRIYGDDLWA